MRLRTRTNMLRVMAALMTFIMLAGGLLSAPSQGQAGGFVWRALGSAGFSAGAANELKVAGYNGTPYVAFSDVANGEKATVMKYDGSEWVTVGSAGFSAGRATNLSFSIDSSNGTAYLAYRDEANGGKATVMKYDGSSWAALGGAGFSDGSASALSLFVRTGMPYLAYNDGTTYKLYVLKYAGSSWSQVGGSAVSDSHVNTSSIYVDSRGGTTIPYVAYEDNYPARGQKATLKKFDGTNWSTVGNAGISDGQPMRISLLIDESTGVPYVGYGQTTSKPIMKKLDGSNWVTVGSGEIATGLGLNASFQVVNGIAYALFIDHDKNNYATLMKSDGGGWEAVGAAGFTEGGSSELALYVDPVSGIPYAAVTEAIRSSKATVMTPTPVLTPPALTADTTGNIAGRDIELTFTDDAVWRAAITSVKNGTTALTSGTQYTVASGVITIKAGVLPTGTHSIKVSATGYDDATVSQPVSAALKVTYVGNGRTSGSEPVDSGSYAQGEHATVKGNTGGLAKTGFAFAGWNTKADGTGTDYAANADLTIDSTNVTLYAKWTVNLTYTIAAISNQTPAALSAGYAAGSQETSTVTVTRTGTGDLTNVTAALSGANAADFDLTQPLVSTLTGAVPSTTFTVKAKDGLAPGSHSATVTVSADQMTPVTFTVTQVVQFMKGDVNGDGQVTPADSLYITKYMQGKLTLTEEQKKILDMNEDGKVDADDAKIIMNIYLGVK